MTQRLFPVQIANEPDDVTLICAPRRDVPLVSASIECRGGAMRDPHACPGLAALIAALFNEGVEGISALQWHQQLERDAISMSVQASTSRWVAQMDCLSADLEKALDMFRQWLVRPGFPVGEWKRLVRKARAGAKEQWAQPISVLGPLARVQVLGYGHPGAHPAFEKSFARARYEQARSLGHTAFTQGNGVYGMIGGDVGVDDGFERLRGLIAVLPEGNDDEPVEPQATASSKRIWILDHPKLDQTFLALGRPGIRAGDQDRAALRLANYMLGGGGFSSRLMARIRSERGHTYGIRSTLPESDLLGTFTIQSFTETGNLPAMRSLIESELEDICTKGFNHQELEAAQSHLHGALPLRLTNPSAVLGAVAHGLRAHLSLEDLENDWHVIRETSLDQTNAAARRLIGDGTFHLALIGPAREILSQIKDRGVVGVFPFRRPPDRWPDPGPQQPITR